MAPSYNALKVLDDLHISAPVGSVPTTTLPLTYFDMHWFPCAPMQSLFFYEFPHSTSQFLDTTLPALKHSLSLTLQHFFPLAAKLICPPPPLKPYILYTDGDSVPLTIVESTADINHLKANYPRDIKLLHPFVPQLPPSSMSTDGSRVLPIMALKVTVFPNAAICVAFAHCHVAADGSAFMHFVRSWSSVCKSKGESTCLNDAALRPSHNRDAIKDPAGCSDDALNVYWHWFSSYRENLGDSPKEMGPVDKVRATFSLTRAQIEKLKQWLTLQCNKNDNNGSEEQLQISTFVVTCSIMWICMIKSQESEEISSANGYNHDNNKDDDKFYYFLFAVDCRSRMEFPLPVTYFGNCLAPAIIKAKKGELLGENGIATAAKSIARKVKEMERGAMKEVEKGPSKLGEMFRSGHYLGVSGSPKLRIYDMDFGWGRPTKIEFPHIDDGATLSLAESRDDAGGMEVSLALRNDKMDAFTAHLEKSLKKEKQIAAPSPCTIKVLDHRHASPPPGSVPNTSLPLTFFDVVYLFCRPNQRLFFYELPYRTLYFTQSILPSLKTSLSHTLQTFYPFATSLICPPSPHKPFILYTDGDSVPFTVAESSADFDRIIDHRDHHARDVKELHAFVPQLPPTYMQNKTRVVPLLSMQITLFPNSGISIGATFCHAVADGRSFNHFIKAWGSITWSASACIEKSAPFLDRKGIMEKDPGGGLDTILLNGWWSWASDWKWDKPPAQDIFTYKFRATFAIGRGDIERLKNYVFRSESKQLRASTFAVSCAFVWSRIVKAQENLNGRGKHKDDKDELEYLCIGADCRNCPELAIPDEYFGNCLSICFVKMKRSELLRENGLVAATKAIGDRVWEFENEALKEAEKWMTDWAEIFKTVHVLTVTGSPKLRAYDTDFGWGKPKKTEVVHLDASRIVSLNDCRDEEGGIEIGLALKRDETVAFNSFFELGLKAI